jgi:hypothetical protein
MQHQRVLACWITAGMGGVVVYLTPHPKLGVMQERGLNEDGDQLESPYVLSCSTILSMANMLPIIGCILNL